MYSEHTEVISYPVYHTGNRKKAEVSDDDEELASQKEISHKLTTS